MPERPSLSERLKAAAESSACAKLYVSLHGKDVWNARLSQQPAAQGTMLVEMGCSNWRVKALQTFRVWWRTCCGR